MKPNGSRNDRRRRRWARHESPPALHLHTPRGAAASAAAGVLLAAGVNLSEAAFARPHEPEPHVTVGTATMGPLRHPRLPVHVADYLRGASHWTERVGLNGSNSVALSGVANGTNSAFAVATVTRETAG
jgi:hypothetical protein